jgi:hypothetical protein
MNKLIKIYQILLLAVLALYINLGKGVAYSYVAEVLLIFGVLIIFLQYKTYEVIWNKRVGILLFFLIINVAYLFRGRVSYPIIEVARDSFVINYAFFAFIIFLFKDQIVALREQIFNIYKYYPLIQVILFFLSQNEKIYEISLFNNVHVLFFKYGDICVHLFIATILQLAGFIKFQKPYNFINIIFIVFILMIASSYSRGGMLSYILGMGLFLIFSPSSLFKEQVKYYLKFIPIAILISMPFFLAIDVDENFQGRKPGLEQLKDNSLSIFSSNQDGNLEDNKLWRLVWWAQIADYTFFGDQFFFGKGIGVNLSLEDGIEVEEGNEIRSPHNYSMTILARYGVPLFITWVYWVYLTFIRLRKKDKSVFVVLYTSILFVFLFNASFDVFLEGPMGGFPFWIFVGLDLASETLLNQNMLPFAEDI